jgi:hypothetical protein
LAKGKRYKSEDDQVGLTPPALARVSRARQVEYMSYWFNARHEDPVRETPYSEGQYVYVHGGPYDANDEIQHEFGSFISYETMKLAIDEVEREGTYDWAPAPNHPEYPQPEYNEANTSYDAPEPSTLDDVIRRLRSGEGTRIGMNTPEEKFERQVLRDHVAVLETALARIRTAPPGPGHNGAREDDEEEAGIERPSLAAAVEAVQTIKTELDAVAPDVLKVAEATSKLSRFASWIARRAEKAVERLVETAMAGAVLAVPHVLPTIVPLIENVSGTVIRWAEYAMAQF